MGLQLSSLGIDTSLLTSNLDKFLDGVEYLDIDGDFEEDSYTILPISGDGDHVLGTFHREEQPSFTHSRRKLSLQDERARRRSITTLTHPADFIEKWPGSERFTTPEQLRPHPFNGGWKNG
ncbi:uncharacterized protein LOC123319964 [Coccinella septempunctata]|uniref:uncharacterized protein LOC123319964 n=1 Tax=Coccinella septempunctata TaxID=41139 RepID=UPI001D08113F|nr:uncharacterized protein LOC123319964 [Coccinella septempunctata]